jgi:hypothetical protein
MNERIIQLMLAVSILIALIVYLWGVGAASTVVGGGLIGLVVMEAELRLERLQK